MCFDSVQKGQLRSVRVEQVLLPPRVDSMASFRFLQRRKSSLFPHLRAHEVHVDARKRPRNNLPRVDEQDAVFARILESTQEYQSQMLWGEMRDLEALEAEFRSSGDVDSLPFVEEAMKATSQRLAQHEGAATAPHRRTVARAEEEKNSDLYSFYQLSNGSYVVLHPFNMKCLLKEYAPKQETTTTEDDISHLLEQVQVSGGGPSAGAVANASDAVFRHHLLPDTIDARVVEIEHVVMDDEALKRYRFLSHLPKFCDFYLCELDLSDQLSPETCDAFRTELKKRVKQRKAREDGGNKHETAASPSLLAMHAPPSFSIDQEGMSWPAPSEATSRPTMEQSYAITDEGLAGLDEATLAAVQAAMMASPSIAPRSFEDAEGSFANVTRNSGYFPALGSSEDSTTGAHSSPSVWGAAPSLIPPEFDLNSAIKSSKRKGSGKKGVSVFSTNQRRSYR